MLKKQDTFWNRDFLIALIGYFFLFMSMTLFFIFPLFFEQFAAPKSRIGLIMGIHSLLAIFVRPLFGRMLDVKGRKKISLAGIAILILVLPWFHFIKDAGLYPLILRALTGIGWGISMTATMTICSDLAPVSRLARSLGIIGVSGLLSAAIGPLLGEEIINRLGFGGLFNICLVFLIISFVCILVTREGIPQGNNNNPQPTKPLVKLTVFSIIVIAAMPILHGAIRSAVVYFIALFTKSLSLSRVGPFFVAFSAAAIVTRLFLGGLSDRHGRKQVVLPSVVLIGLNLMLISQMQSSWLLILTGFLGGLGQGLIFPALSTYIIDIMGRENKGLAISLYLTLFDVGMAFGSAIFGWMVDLYGFRFMYLLAGGVFILVGAIFTWKAPNPKSTSVVVDR